MMLRVLLGVWLSVVHSELDARCDKLSCRTGGQNDAARYSGSVCLLYTLS